CLSDTIAVFYSRRAYARSTLFPYTTLFRSVYSWVSPAMAAFKLREVSPMGRPVAGSPTPSMNSRCPCAWPVSPSAVERNTAATRSEEHTSELQSPCNLVCRLLLEKKKQGRA